MRRLTVIASLVFLPTLVHAQVRGGTGAGRTTISAPRVMARSGPVAVRSAAGAPLAYRSGQARSPGGVISTRRLNNQPTGRQNAALSNQNAFLPDFTASPGLGFDFVHFAATHPNAGRRHGGRNDGFFPFFDSGFLLPYAPIYASDQQDESPRYDSQPQGAVAAANDASSSNRRYPGYGLEAVSTYDVIVAPQKPSESYVFVRRDGTLFFAVAYSWADGTLYYVTQEGLRRSVGRDALDLDATQQFNEQRGLSFRSPA
jgi:hypothetical protein